MVKEVIIVAKNGFGKGKKISIDGEEHIIQRVEEPRCGDTWYYEMSGKVFGELDFVKPLKEGRLISAWKNDKKTMFVVDKYDTDAKTYKLKGVYE